MPEDYKSFLLLTNGGILSNEVSYYFETKSLSEPIELTVFLGNKQENRIYDLGYWYSQCHYEYHNLNIALIALADPGEIMLVNEPGKEGVYLWDDSLELETSTEDNCMYKIADSFEEFVSKIYVEEI